VKQIDKVGRPDIDAFMERKGEGGRQLGFLVTFGYNKGPNRNAPPSTARLSSPKSSERAESSSC
jgi:hypothetical protein